MPYRASCFVAWLDVCLSAVATFSVGVRRVAVALFLAGQVRSDLAICQAFRHKFVSRNLADWRVMQGQGFSEAHEGNFTEAGQSQLTGGLSPGGFFWPASGQNLNRLKSDFESPGQDRSDCLLHCDSISA